MPPMAFSAIYDLVIDERDVRIYSNGTGDPVLMLPDLGSSAATWECLTGRVVAGDRQLVAVDLPGSGHSDPLPAADPAGYVDHVRRVVEHLGPEPVDVVGCGFGGYLAAGVAARDPQLIRHLVIEHPLLPPRSGRPVSSRMSASMAVGGAFTTLRRGRIKHNVGGFARARSVLAELAAADPAWWRRLAQITAPTLIVGAAEADAGGRARLDLLADAIPGAERAELAGARRGHASDPDGFADLMLPFLAR